MRALGSWRCRSRTFSPTLVGLPPPSGTKFLALWHSSKTTRPSKSEPHHSTSWSKRVKPCGSETDRSQTAWLSKYGLQGF